MPSQEQSRDAQESPLDRTRRQLAEHVAWHQRANPSFALAGALAIIAVNGQEPASVLSDADFLDPATSEYLQHAIAGASPS